jgi:hypothetical protein
VINKSCMWAMLGLCGSLLTVAAPTVSHAADPPAQPAATADAKPETLKCVNLDRPGSHIKARVCGIPAEWSAARGRLDLLLQNQAVSIGAVGVNTPVYSPSVPGMNGFGTGASQASFQR